MEQLIKPVKPISTEMREDILAELRRRFPHVLFRGYWDDFLKAHTVEVNNRKFDSSKEYLIALGDLEDKYSPDHDILMEMYFMTGEFTKNNMKAGLREDEASTVILR